MTGDKFDLVNDFGYTPEYRNGFIYFTLSNESARNRAVFESDTKLFDKFIFFLSFVYSDGSNGKMDKPKWSYWSQGTEVNSFNINVTFKATGVGSGKEGINDVIDNVSITLPFKLLFISGEYVDE